MGEFTSNRWTMSIDGRLAIGSVVQRLSIDGWSQYHFGSTIYAARDGDLLSQPTNIGDYSRQKFALLPSIELRLHYLLLKSLRFNVGYSFMYLSNVVRAGDQIDLTINTSQITGTLSGPARPQAVFQDTSFWMHGFMLGVDWMF